MPGLDATRLRALADELEREEAEAKREAEDAETRAEREKAEKRVAELEAKIATLEQRLAGGDAPPAADPAAADDPDPDAADDPDPEPKPKMRKGRKRGMTYQDAPGEPAYVWQQDDEPDLVPVDDDAAAA